MIFELPYYGDQEKYSGNQGTSKQSVENFINALKKRNFPAENISDNGKCFLIDTKGTALCVKTAEQGDYVVSKLYYNDRKLATTHTNRVSKHDTSKNFLAPMLDVHYISGQKINLSLTGEEISEEVELIECFFKEEWSNWKCRNYSPSYFMKSESLLEEKIEPIVKKLCGFETEKPDIQQCIKVKRVTYQIIGKIREIKKEQRGHMAKNQLLKLLQEILPDDPKKDSKKYALLREIKNKIEKSNIETDDELRAAARNAIMLCMQCRSMFTFSGKTTSGEKILTELVLFKNGKYEYEELRGLMHLEGKITYADLLKMNTHLDQSDTFVANTRRFQYYSSFSKHLMYKAYTDNGIKLFSENISRKPSR